MLSPNFRVVLTGLWVRIITNRFAVIGAQSSSSPVYLQKALASPSTASGLSLLEHLSPAWLSLCFNLIVATFAVHIAEWFLQENWPVVGYKGLVVVYRDFQ